MDLSELLDDTERDWACADCAAIWPHLGAPPSDERCEHCSGPLVDPRLVLVGAAA
jgi:hypothetical protein